MRLSGTVGLGKPQQLLSARSVVLHDPSKRSYNAALPNTISHSNTCVAIGVVNYRKLFASQTNMWLAKSGLTNDILSLLFFVYGVMYVIWSLAGMEPLVNCDSTLSYMNVYGIVYIIQRKRKHSINYIFVFLCIGVLCIAVIKRTYNCQAVCWHITLGCVVSCTFLSSCIS